MDSQSLLPINLRTDNLGIFYATYLKHLLDCIQFDVDYVYTKEHCKDVPALAQKIVNGLLTGSASKDGKAVKLACQDLKINHTYKAIQQFINQ